MDNLGIIRNVCDKGESWFVTPDRAEKLFKLNAAVFQTEECEIKNGILQDMVKYFFKGYEVYEPSFEPALFRKGIDYAYDTFCRPHVLYFGWLKIVADVNSQKADKYIAEVEGELNTWIETKPNKN